MNPFRSNRHKQGQGSGSEGIDSSADDTPDGSPIANLPVSRLRKNNSDSEDNSRTMNAAGAGGSFVPNGRRDVSPNSASSLSETDVRRELSFNSYDLPIIREVHSRANSKKSFGGSSGLSRASSTTKYLIKSLESRLQEQEKQLAKKDELVERLVLAMKSDSKDNVQQSHELLQGLSNAAPSAIQIAVNTTTETSSDNAAAVQHHETQSTDFVIPTISSHPDSSDDSGDKTPPPVPQNCLVRLLERAVQSKVCVGVLLGCLFTQNYRMSRLLQEKTRKKCMQQRRDNVLIRLKDAITPPP
ncbi:hypothetical protein CYMTET_51103 [Cymbomonas tetramitiformis]|uniref:Uncharacterized protein n=1 Tax=Cymbomonas tetramitiformis TaxID=36881 RepID=A0AAE0ESH4_9CHLO|nr:hypothetical protein CYMTET_51103 [Cymbomonas tetramitiformis]